MKYKYEILQTLRELKNKKAENHCMSVDVTYDICGTVSCIAGDMALKCRIPTWCYTTYTEDGETFVDSVGFDELFAEMEMPNWIFLALFGVDTGEKIHGMSLWDYDNRSKETPEETYRKALKALHYYCRKEAIMCGGTPEYEAARHSEGNLMLVTSP